ncbi:RagB/SusD family nutrient uptake outer membrane protein [Chitinophaga sp. SYP-B3965]|uniref:RagB/SusD family nutrient uptake outer membrane protein n=1 Tax=Chitinophaga sp. SYP-B3965 TaxID=2663120 RepID=UPI0012995F32|nr:RagB/SusD family nutrient uptake outer membrane protein [Chitinophaga sp. SYP-B3965]MRG45269.1 RagB/SusD family nutrient uptake outer membrane protein [Chitinophaga sp. SYP-B3965]
MKKSYILILFAALAVSCQKDLDEKIVSGITAGSYFVDAPGLTGGVNAAYSTLRQFYGQEQGFSMTEYGVDTYTEGRDGSFKYFNEYTVGFTAGATYTTNLYTNYFAGINGCNTVVDRADGIPGLDSVFKRTRVAEARFLRALYYFTLVQTFGDLPLSLHEINSINTETIRASEDKIYTDAIIPDLLYAITNLPVTQPEYGRATQAAAKALLARVYLVREKWQDAADLSQSVIDDYNFSLSDSYGAIFSMNNQKNSEVIWSVQFSTSELLNGEGNSAHLYFVPVYENAAGMQRDVLNGRPYNRFKFTAYGNSLFDRQADKRYTEGFQHVYYCNNLATAPAGMKLGDTAILVTTENVPQSEKAKHNYKIWDSTLINSTADRTMFLCPVKFLDPLRSSAGITAGSRSFFVFRIAEMYLNIAEAQVMLQRPADARNTINILRAKRSVTGTDLTVSTPAVPDLNFILDERARELFGEQQRWFDLKRTGTLVSRVKLYNPEAAAIKDFHTLRPFPQQEIDRSTNSVPPNPGYN